jgi:hypothetical protein
MSSALWSRHYITLSDIKSCLTASALRIKITTKNLENKKTKQKKKQNSQTCWYILEWDVALCICSEFGCRVCGRKREYMCDTPEIASDASCIERISFKYISCWFKFLK